jgi:hypothetical protein
MKRFFILIESEYKDLKITALKKTEFILILSYI